MSQAGKVLYLRREPTVDPVLNAWAPDAALERRDVVAYADPNMIEVVRRWPWHFTFSKPRGFRKRIKINGLLFRIVWMSDVLAPKGVG